MTDLDRLMDKVQPVPWSGCWLWTAAVNRNGYGVFGLKRRIRLAHCASYEMHRGQIPEGLELDHLCRVPCCVNPDHLEAVTHRVNILRGNTRSYIRVTHCPRGHPYDEVNAYRFFVGDGRELARNCRVCCREAARRYRLRQKEARS
jgi:hypothetical protein